MQAAPDLQAHPPPTLRFTGALRLAGLVQYVPLPVVGGYLCFVGYFCLAAGEWG